ncbi:peptidylprolyl isomerase [bacterium]|nr:peptidylprolyl isomerase [bacterium]
MKKQHLSLVLLLLLVLTAQSAELVDHILIVVNDDIILASDMSSYVNSYIAQIGRPPESEEELTQITLAVFMQMVTTKVMEQEARRQGLSVTYAELEAIVNDQLASSAAMYPSHDEFLAALDEAGMSEAQLEDMYRSEARSQLLINQLLQHRYSANISVTEEEIDDYLAEHNTSTEKRLVFDLRDVTAYLRTGQGTEEAVRAEAARLATQARRGGDFIAFANQHSDALVDMGNVQRRDLDEAFTVAVFSLNEGQISEPVRTSLGWHVIKVLERIDDNTLHLAQIQLSISPTREDEERVYAALAAARELLSEDKNARLSFLSDYTDILESENRSVSLSRIESGDPALAVELKNLPVGGMTADYTVGDGTRFSVLLRREERSDQSREDVRLAIFNQRVDEKREEWVQDLIGEAWIEVKQEELKGLLPDGPGSR